jgi:hypothetical protein
LRRHVAGLKKCPNYVVAAAEPPQSCKWVVSEAAAPADSDLL